MSLAVSTCSLAASRPPGVTPPAPPARPAGADAVSVIRNADTLAVFVRVPAGPRTFALHLHSDRNATVPRFSDVSPRKPPGGPAARPSDRESWYPVIDFAVDQAMEAVVELADIPDGTQVSWNGWVRRERQRAASPLHVPAERLLYWENTLWIDRREPRITQFYVRQPFSPSPADSSVPAVIVRGLAPDWSGRIEVVARDGSGAESVFFTRRIEALDTRPAGVPRPEGEGLHPARLRGALAGAIEYTLRSEVIDPRDPMRGGLYLFYDLDARTFRSSHWVWGWGPSAGLLLEARRVPEIAALFGPARLLRAATEIGEASLRTVPHEPDHPARHMPVSRWDRSPRFDYGHEFAFTPCDAAFLAAWTWVPLAEATGDPKWLHASTKLALALERLMAEFPIPPQNYWPDYGRWDDKVIDEAGFGVELFDALHRVTGDPKMRELGRRYIEQHIAALGRDDGLWDRTHFLDGRPNTPTVRMTRGLGWPMEGLLAAHRLLPQGGRYLELAQRMAGHLLAAQQPGGWWVHRFDQPVELWGVGTKGTALWSWLLYELHRHTGDARHLAAARRALAWLLDEQYFGDDANARGGHVTVSPHSAVGYRPWYRVTCTYGAAFFGLALLQELQLQERDDFSARSSR